MRVGAGAAVQRVVAGETPQGIVASISGERVVEGRADEVLKARQRIGAGAEGVLRLGHGKADRHPGCARS